MDFPPFKPKEKKRLNTIAFYNLENLYDTIDDPDTLDDDFTPEGAKKWSNKRYQKKLYKLAKTLSEVGPPEANDPPVLVGVAEVENKTVVENLIGAEPLEKMDYGYVHYDSPDERGIDCALIYHRPYFKVLHSEPIPLLVFEPDGRRDRTRDILYVKGKLNGEEVHVFVNHWPSRRKEGSKTQYKRVQAAETLRKFMAGVASRTKNPNYIIMGDFNDGPASDSVTSLVTSELLINPMEKLLTPERGSANYRRTWMLFDQIMVSRSFLEEKKHTHSLAHSNIFDEHFLTEFEGRYKGTPYRTYVGSKYMGGYSDHFPVYIQLRYDG